MHSIPSRQENAKVMNNAPIITDIYMVHKLKQDIKSGDDGKYLLFLSFFPFVYGRALY